MIEYYAAEKNEKPLDALFGKVFIIYHLVEELRAKVITNLTMATRSEVTWSPLDGTFSPITASVSATSSPTTCDPQTSCTPAPGLLHLSTPPPGRFSPSCILGQLNPLQVFAVHLIRPKLVKPVFTFLTVVPIPIPLWRAELKFFLSHHILRHLLILCL